MSNGRYFEDQSLLLFLYEILKNNRDVMEKNSIPLEKISSLKRTQTSSNSEYYYVSHYKSQREDCKIFG